MQRSMYVCLFILARARNSCVTTTCSVRLIIKLCFFNIPDNGVCNILCGLFSIHTRYTGVLIKKKIRLFGINIGL